MDARAHPGTGFARRRLTCSRLMEPLRLLVLAAPADAQRAVDAVRVGGAVEAALAPTADALRAGLADPAWQAVLVVPGGPVAHADLADALDGESRPVVVVGQGVPSDLAGVVTMALVWEGLDALPLVVSGWLSADAEGGDAEGGAEASAERHPLASAPGADEAWVARHDAASEASGPPHADAPASDDAPAPPAADGPAVEAPSAPAAPTSGRGEEDGASFAHESLVEDAPEVAALTEHLPIGVYRSTPDGRILWANPALASLLGCDSVEALATIDVRRDLGYPRDAFVESIQAEGEVRNLVVSWVDRWGRTVHTRENARAVTDATGAVRYFEGTMEDVTAEVEARETERLRARQHAAVAHFAAAADAARTPEALHEAAVRALLDATGADGVVFTERALTESGARVNRCTATAGDLVDGAAHVLDTDSGFAEMAFAPAVALVRDASERGPDWMPPSVREAMLARGIRAAGVFPLLRSGELLGTLATVYRAPHTFSPSEVQVAEALAWHLAGHLARHHAERDLRDSEASLRFLAEHTGQVLYRIRYADAPGQPWAFDYLSPAIEALTGYDADALAEVGGLGALIEHREVFAGDGLIDGPLGDSCDAHYLAGYRLTTRDGQTRWVENSAYPWCEDGRPVGLVGVMLDVTDRRRLEEVAADAAQQVFARQTALVDLARSDHADLGTLLARIVEVAAETTAADGAAVWLADGPWVVRRAVQAAPGTDPPGGASLPVEAFESAMERLHGERVLAASGADLPAGLVAFAGGAPSLIAAPVRRRGEAVGLLVLAGDGDAWSDGESDVAAALADTIALAFERDERARAETALRRSEARYRALADLTSDYAFAVHRRPDGTAAVAWATDAFERITGHPVDALLDPARRAAVVRPASLGAAAAALDAMPSAAGDPHEIELDDRAGATRWIAHRARVAEVAPDGTALVYHSGQDVTERRRALAAIVAAREQAEAGREAAEAMARLKSAFLANMSHEIRTPLTSILGYSELLMSEVADEHREFVDLIARGGRRLLDTLNSLLDLARLEADSVRPDPRRLSVGAEVWGAVEPLRPLADEAGLDLHVAVADEAEATLDHACLARVVAHLVGNAIKFTPAGTVRVDVWTAGGEVVLRVSDTGIGIAPEFLPHLFEEFRQEETGDGRSHEGAGLGLSITHRLVTLMGGRIHVESRRPGGTTVTVTFPAAPSHHGDGALVLAPSLVAAPSAMTDHPFGPTPAPPAPAAPAPAAEAPPAPVAGRPLVPADGPSDAAPADRQPSVPVLVPASTVETADGPLAPRWRRPLAASPAGGPGSAPPIETSPGDRAAADPTPVGTTRPDDLPASGPEATTSQPDAAARVPATAEPVMIVRPSPPPEPAPVAAPDDARPAILVVEDNADTRMLLDRILRASYRVTAVGDARAALVEMNRQRFHGFVLDINLGGKETGTDVLRVARTLDGYADVFAIALTAYALPGDRDRLLEAGFDEYLSKPFTRQALLDALAAGVRV